MTPETLSAWARVVVRDIAAPAVGLFLCIYLAVTGNFSPWQLPLLAGLAGIQLVARGKAPRSDPELPTTEQAAPGSASEG